LRSLSHSFRNSVLRLYFRQKENACNTHESILYLAYQEIPFHHGTTEDPLVWPVSSCFLFDNSSLACRNMSQLFKQNLWWLLPCRVS
jgi:hypothetical protein